jgi:hypothetical protein
MPVTEQLPVSILREILRYEPETGHLFWLPRGEHLFSEWGYGGAPTAAARWNARYAGQRAFTATTRLGHYKGAIFDADYRAHRVIWALVTGEWPSASIDHINGDAGDNRWANLRAATATENARNRKSRTGSTSKYLGVRKEASSTKYRAQIRLNGKLKHLGLFVREEDAARAYDTAAIAAYGEFARPNFGEVT